MTFRPSSLTLALTLVLGALATLVAPGCSSEEGQTPNCPPLTLYPIGEGGRRDDDDIVQERAAAVDAGCMTDLGDASTAAP